MDFYDATALMRLVQAVENDPYVSSGAGEALADKVREFIEDEAELGGWYTELMNAIGESEITDPLADFTVGRFRVHLVQEGERYGAGGGFVYGKALSNGSSGIPINDCQLYGHGLPLVEFYDVSQDPAKFPEGQFVTRYYMSTLLGMDSIGDSIGEMSALGLDGGVPNWPSGAMTCRRSMRTSAPHASNLNLTPSAGLIRITASDSMRKRGRCRVTSSVSQSRKDGGCSSATMTSQTVTPTTTSPMTS